MSITFIAILCLCNWKKSNEGKYDDENCFLFCGPDKEHKNGV